MAHFDKIHRLIRDIKGAESECCRKIFIKAKLWSTYLWSLNKRPFGTGQNATTKKRWMELFKYTYDIHSPIFTKYVARIGTAWGMPYSTTEEKQSIFDNVLEMFTFSHHGSHPKLANWFAWNSQAEIQIKEFWAAKMIFESQVADEDPDARLLCIVSCFHIHCEMN